ncbi:MAG: hypothetical protein LC795_22645 [Acidobacteria bacterium]|nr:hypothetical protein [Acidobacteriota bacterium]
MSVSESVSVPVTPMRTSDGSGGTGRGWTAGKFGSSSPVFVVVAGGTPVCVGSAGAAGLGAVAAGGCVVEGVWTPGGVCGAGRCVPGGVRGSCGFGRAPGGTLCCCSVPGGRVASRCAGVCGGVDCGSAAPAVSTTKGSPTLVKTGLAGVALVSAGVFPKADTAFPKTRSAHRQVEARATIVLRLASIDRLSLTIFSTLKLFRRVGTPAGARGIQESKCERPERVANGAPRPPL